MKLVEIGSDEKAGTAWKPVRKRTLRSQFEDATEQAVLAKLINEKLLVSNAPIETGNRRFASSQGSTVEIAHEVLLTSWTTLNQWITDNRQAIDLRNRLNEDAELWRQKDKAESELWSGSKLAQALELRSNLEFQQVLGGFDSQENEFIDASKGLRDRQLRRTRLAAGIGLALATIASSAAILAGYQLQQTARQRVEQYAATSEALIATNPTEALVYAIAAVGMSRSPFIKFPSYSAPQSINRALFNALQTGREANAFQLANSKISQMVFSADGQNVLTISDGVVHQWTLKDSSPRELFRVHSTGDSWYSNSLVTLSSNGQWILTREVNNESRSANGTFQLRDSTGKPVGKLFEGPAQEGAGVLSPNGQHIIGYSERLPGGPKVFLWNLQDYFSQQQSKRKNTYLVLYDFYEGAESIDYSSFSYNGQWFIGGMSGTKSTTIVYLQNNPVKKLLSLPVGFITSAAISSDGRKIAVGDGEGNIYTWGTSLTKDIHLPSENVAVQKETKLQRKGHTAPVESITFSLDGQLIASGGQDGSIRLWNASSLTLISDPLQIQRTSIGRLAFSPDSKYLISNSLDGIVRVWDIQENLPDSLKYNINFSGATRLSSVGFSPDGQYIISEVIGYFTNGELISNLQGQNVEEEKKAAITKVTDLSKQTNVALNPDGTKIVKINADEQGFRMYEVKIPRWLEIACNRLRYHPILIKPETDIARKAQNTCEQYVWSHNTLP